MVRGLWVRGLLVPICCLVIFFGVINSADGRAGGGGGFRSGSVSSGSYNSSSSYSGNGESGAYLIYAVFYIFFKYPYLTILALLIYIAAISLGGKSKRQLCF
ncbi:MAG: hypothetical protein GY750_08995 [Lentisphaerae bacterium]|nr:hypothetical protein [Lentisphaerota bacterium]MCP4101547.1 hypothetical protein [Lentisphaerota bacterium]